MKEYYYIPDPVDIKEGYQYEFNGMSTGGMTFIDFSNLTATPGLVKPPSIKIWTKESCSDKSGNYIFSSGFRKSADIIQLIKTEQIRVKYLDQNDLKLLGWEHVATMANGGSKMYQYKDSNFSLRYNGQNTYYEQNNLKALRKVTVQLLDQKSLDQRTLYNGPCKSINELKDIMRNLKLL